MPQVDIITNDRRHRRWSLEEKQSILAAAFGAPGVVIKDVAQRANISTGQLYTWRKQLMKKGRMTQAAFSRVVAVADGQSVTELPLLANSMVCRDPVAPANPTAIELEIRGHKVKIPATMPVALASAVVRALVRR